MGDLAQVVALDAVDPIELPNGSWSRMLVTADRVGGNRGSLGYSVFTPGTTLAPVRHETEEFAYVVSGRGEILLDDGPLAFAQGDALYIPTLWWHHVESLSKYNMLVNYWWKGWVGSAATTGSALDCLAHSVLNLRHLPPEHRQAWRAIFDHYVFGSGDDPAAHIPAHKRGILGKISPDLAKQIRAFLVKQLQR